MLPVKRRRAALPLLIAAIILVLLLFPQAVGASSTLQNGNFIQDMAGWYTGSWIAGAADWEVDAGVLRMESGEMNDVRLKQDVLLEPGVTYRINCQVKVETLSREGEAGAWVGFDYSPAKISARLDSTDWQDLYFYATSGSAQTSATFCLALGDYGSLASGRAYFRNVEIYPESAPSGYTVLSMESYPMEDAATTEEPYALGYWSQVLNKLLLAALCFVLVYALWRWGQKSRWILPARWEWLFAGSILAAAFLLRFGGTLLSEGYPVDTNTFAAWSARLVEVGPSRFYSDSYFSDYPPGILYLFWLSGELCHHLGLVVTRSGLGLGLLFLPIMLCDIALCALIWRKARQKLGVMPGLAMLLIMAFHPVLLYDTAVWHQVDVVLGLTLAGTFLLLEKDKKLWAAAVYGLAVLAKPQALMLGPAFAMPYLRPLFDQKTRKKGLIDLAAGAAIAFGVIFALSIPFTGDQPFWPFSGSGNWLIEKYFTTATSYPYATVNAHNIYTLFGGNFLPQEALLGPLSYAHWAMLGLVFVLAASALLYFFSTRKGTEGQTLTLIAAFMLAGLFTFGPRMHERYSFPLMVLLPLAYIQLKDKGVLNVFAMYSAGIFANMSLALLALNDMNAYHQTAYTVACNISAAYNILCFAYLSLVCYDICVRNHRYLPRLHEPAFSLGFRFPRSASAQPISLFSNVAQAFVGKSTAEIDSQTDVTSLLEDTLPGKTEDPALQKRRVTSRRSAPRRGRDTRWLEGRLCLRDHRLHWARWDSIFVGALTLIYAIIAFTRLGTTDVPESYWRGLSGQEIHLAFDSPTAIREVWSYGGISDGKLEIIQPGSGANALLLSQEGENADSEYLSQEESGGENLLVQQNVDYDVMYRWTVNDVNFQAEELILRASGNTWLEELVFVGEDGQIHTPRIIQASGEASPDENSNPAHLFDEQDSKPERPDVLNGMYFDELYHGRTAYEHLHGLAPYENTHPPLGKIFIMLGISLFGMNPFGWRVVGTLFGVAMVPIFYLLAKRLLKDRKLAAFITVLFTFDFMHFAQTRIATIDVYGVFFILLMYYFMLEYWQMNFYVDGVKATLRPLALSGLFFGLGAASKWISIYAGLGLAVIFFVSLAMRLSEYIVARSALARGQAGAAAFVEKTSPLGESLLWTLGTCIIMFIVVPVIIYVASYTPYLLATEQNYDLSSIGEIQRNMFRYHEGLTARHPYESSWWTWPFDARPIYYYQASRLPEGLGGVISSFGNPIVWWAGFASMVALVVRGIRRKHFDRTTLFILIAFAAQFLPWSFITRATFIYHYFASVPFILLATGYAFKLWKARWSHAQYVAWGIAAAAVLVFILYYPAISGLPVSRAYLDALRLFPGWTW